MPDIPDRDDLEREYARAVSRLLKKLAGDLLETLGDPPNLDNLNNEFWDARTKEALSILLPFGENIFLAAAQRMMASNPAGVDWDLVNEAAVDWASKYTFDLVRDIRAKDMIYLQKMVSAYYREGQNRGQLEERIRRRYGPVRAEMIAVTEITRAAALGEFQSITELWKSGIHMIATWQTNADELVCPICRPLNGRKADRYDAVTGQPYWRHPETGIEYSINPPHPRDRCWRNYELPKVGR